MKKFLFVLVISLTGCSPLVQLAHQPLPDKQYLILQLEKADVYFLKEDVMQVVEAGQAKTVSSLSSDEIDALALKVQKWTSGNLAFPIQRDDSDGSLTSDAHRLLSLTYQQLLEDDKYMVFNKVSGAFEEGVYVAKVKSKEGSKKGYFFRNGDEFHSEPGLRR